MAKTQKDDGKAGQDSSGKPGTAVVGNQRADSPVAVETGRFEGPDADQRRRQDQIDDAFRRAQATKAADPEKERWNAARDVLEAELVRHDRAFDGFCGGLTSCTPTLTPMMLHNRRLAAIRVAEAPDSSLSEIETATEMLQQVVFHPDEAPAPGKDDGGSA